MKEMIRKSIIRPQWMKWEMGFGLLSRLRSSYVAQFGICRVMVRKHRGESICCQDGTYIRPGDPIGELHLDNGKVLELLESKGSDRAALAVARLVGESLKQINRAIEFRPEMKPIKALVGVTLLLHRGITHGLGFERHPLKLGMFERLSTSYLRLLLSVMHPDGQKRIGRRKERLVPIMLVHTRDSLKIRFMPRSEMAGSFRYASSQTVPFEVVAAIRPVSVEQAAADAG